MARNQKPLLPMRNRKPPRKPTDEDAKPEDDAKNLQGEWRIVEAEKDGKEIRNDPTGLSALLGAKVIFKEDEMIMRSITKKFRLDSGTSPRRNSYDELDRSVQRSDCPGYLLVGEGRV